MRQMFLMFLLSVFFVSMKAQSIAGKVGVIELKTIEHRVVDKENGKGNTLSNKHNHPRTIAYFNSKGRLLKFLQYKFDDHFAENELSSLSLYHYRDSLLVREDVYEYRERYEKGYKENPHLRDSVVYTYDYLGRLFSQKTFYLFKDTLFYYENNPSQKIRRLKKYEYLENPNRIKIMYNEHNYTLKILDSLGRVVVEVHVADDKIWNRYIANYLSGRHEITTTFLGGKPVNRLTEVVYSENPKFIKSIEDFGDEHSKYKWKTIFYYGKNGLLRKKELFSSYKNEPYMLDEIDEYRWKIGNVKLTPNLLSKIQ